VIIDYKGSRRPPITAPGRGATDYCKVYGWQLRTYAHIRDHQPGSLPVVLGVVIYLNELFPSWDDLKQLGVEIANGTTDVIPTPASADWRIIQMREPPRKSPACKKNREISWGFRMRRALRLEPVYETQVLEAMTRFDRYVRVIEICRAKEALWGSILSAWQKNTSDPGTCRACDYQTFCPRYRSGFASPTLPSV
jgi:hypothetical protein